MAQVATYTLIDAKSADGTYNTCTNQANVVARTVYITGTLNGTVKIEASPSQTGNDWTEVFSETTLGAHVFDADPLVCHRLRAKLTGMVAGPVTVRVACRIEQF